MIKYIPLFFILVSCAVFQKNKTDQAQSAAMQRFVVNDSENELYTRFRYKPIKGLGYEEGTHRRDPSSIIKVNDTYYVWYTYCKDNKSSWLNQAGLNYLLIASIKIITEN